MFNHYAKWRKVDLHIHSVASIGDSNLSVDEILSEAKEKEIDLIALTDHSNVKNIDEFISKSESVGISALPGVELKTEMGRPPVHIISIFPKEITQTTISEDFLNPLGVTERSIKEKGEIALNGNGNQSQFYQRGLYEITVNFREASNKTHELGGLVIVHAGKKSNSFERIPHCRENASLSDIWNSLSAEKSDLMKNKIDICELHSYDKRQIEFYLNDFYKPTIICSDSHKKGCIGEIFTWIKMDTIDFNGLRQIIFEPDIRIKYKESSIKRDYYYINNLESDHGYFKDLNMILSPDLNTVIGGNSTGKSVLIDYLRFVFDNPPQESIKLDFNSRLYGLLREKSSVKVTLIKNDNKAADISRSLTMKKESVESEPYDASEKPVIDSADGNLSNFKIEVYSQGELKEIIRQRNQLLKIFDGLGDYKDLLSFRDELLFQLQENKQKINQFYERIKNHSEKIIEQNQLKEKIRKTKSKIEDPIVSEFQKWQYEKTIFDVFENNLSQAKKTFQKFSVEISNLLKFDVKKDDSINKDLIKKLILKNEDIKLFLNSFNIDFDTKISKLKDEVNAIKISSNWESNYLQKEKMFKQYSIEQGIQNIDIDLNNIKEWESSIIEIEKTNLPKYNELKKSIDTLYFDRNCLLYELNILNSEIEAKRIDNIEKLKIKFKNIEFELIEPGYKDYHEFCKTKFIGCGIKKFDQQFKNFTECKIEPSDFVKYVNNSDVKKLSEVCNITNNSSSIMLGCFLENIPGIEHNFSESYLSLQEKFINPGIKLTIINNDGKKIDFKNLSPGKQCSFLLSILFSSSNYPLIIDQPEDQLDSEYIDTIIDSLRKNKGKRQFIIVTHNQNITVLGDSEKIIKVSKDETNTASNQGRIIATGAVERDTVRDGILSLEGGPDAFRKRAEKYGIKLIK